MPRDARRLDVTDDGRGVDADGSGPPNGYVDFLGFHAPAGGWLFCGWTAEAWAEPDAALHARFEAGTVSGEAAAAFFPRADLGGAGLGVILFVPASAHRVGPLRDLIVRIGERNVRLVAASGAAALVGSELAERAAAMVAIADPGRGRGALHAALTQLPYDGRDTLAELGPAVRAAVDEAFACPPHGLVLTGWLLASGESPRLRLRAGDWSTPVHLDDCLRIERDDVVQAVPEAGPADRRCGFITYLPQAVPFGERAYLEVQGPAGTAYLPVPPPRLRGLAAIRRLLALFESRYAEVALAFDRVIGPAIRAINRARLTERPVPSVTPFGPVEPAPTCSLIVPLYGRIDFLEYQLAALSHGGLEGGELIVVLDDPDRLRETQALAESAWERFRVPFRLAALDHNLGYAPANNAGLRLAGGRHVCFLNSDVIPDRPGWIAALTGRLDADPTLGAVGPLLVFEDGSVQHEGISFEPVACFGGWQFPQHPRKGWKPEGAGLRRCEAITGACLVMRTEQARALGGFDEEYVIGDFEDTDLCLRLARDGLGCAVDRDVQLVHLERRSQAGPARWRTNLTLYNAWLHQRRWFEHAAPA